jgi:prepilin-type processing-associated H-X9-DG protein
MLKQDISPQVFIAAGSGKQLPPNFDTLTPEQKAAWIEQNGDYVYLGKGKNNTLPADQPLAHEKPEVNQGQGMNILFGDGHVEYVPMYRAVEILNSASKPPSP